MQKNSTFICLYNRIFFIEVYMRTSVEVNGTHPPALVGLVPFLCLPGDPTS